MNQLLEKIIFTPSGEKRISVNVQDITKLDEPIDVMTVSSYYRGYKPTNRTMIGALYQNGICVEDLAQSPAIDLRDMCNIWLSEEVSSSRLPIHRIGCIELSDYRSDRRVDKKLEAQIISSIQSYFHMLHIASLSGISIETVGLPILGGGDQRIDPAIITLPTINECVHFLMENESCKRICIISYNAAQAYQFARCLENSYSTQKQEQTNKREYDISRQHSSEGRSVFISYSSIDKNIADNLCAKLESKGIKVWYAPRNIHAQDYATAIVDAITTCTHFVVILSKNSLSSNHVLNEIDLACQELTRQIHICPLKIDEEEMGPAFTYYLSRHHWLDACIPPLEKRLEEFADSLVSD